MKKYIFTTILILFCRALVSAQDTPPPEMQHVQPELLNPVVYKVWIDNEVRKKWYLWGITDSTLILGTSPDNPNTGLDTIPVEQVTWLKTRKVGSVAKGLAIGAGVAGLGGAIGGYEKGDDPPPPRATIDRIVFSYTAKQKARYAAILLTPVGMIVGGIVGSVKDVTTLNGSRALLAAEKQNLKQYLRWK